jgi:HSP20 family protein
MALRPSRAGFSVARRMSERARAAQKAGEGSSPGDPDIVGAGGFAGIVDALRGLVTQLSQAAEAAKQATEGATPEEAQHTRTFSVGGKEAKMVFGYTLRMGQDGVSAEPFGDVPEAPTRPASPQAAAAPARQPIVEMFEEGNAVVVVAELPGADPEGITCRVDGAHLLIETSGERRYRKELTLPVSVRAEGLSQSFRNGILEVRLMRAGA